jgi:hypothetical protein
MLLDPDPDPGQLNEWDSGSTTLQVQRIYFCYVLFRAEQELILDTEDPEGGWVDTHHFADQVRLILCSYFKYRTRVNICYKVS